MTQAARLNNGRASFSPFSVVPVSGFRGWWRKRTRSSYLRCLAVSPAAGQNRSLPLPATSWVLARIRMNALASSSRGEQKRKKKEEEEEEEENIGDWSEDASFARSYNLRRKRCCKNTARKFKREEKARTVVDLEREKDIEFLLNIEFNHLLFSKEQIHRLLFLFNDDFWRKKKISDC